MVELSSDADLEKAVAAGKRHAVMLVDRQPSQELNVFALTDKVSVLDFTAKWCGPCKMIAPEYTKMSAEYPKVLRAAKCCT